MSMLDPNDFFSGGKYSAEGAGIVNGTATINIAPVSDTGRCMIRIQAAQGAVPTAFAHSKGGYATYTEALEAVQHVINELNA